MNWPAVGFVFAFCILGLDVVFSARPGEAQTMPCCAESIGTTACQDMKARHPRRFQQRCETSPDFAISQCCQTCGTMVADLGRQLFANGTRSRHCFDRHNRRFCSFFVNPANDWSGNVQAMSCNGETVAIAFQMCRRTCGFCDPELYTDEKIDPRCPQVVQPMRLSFMHAKPTWIQRV